MFTYLCAHKLIHVYIVLRPYTDTCLHASTLIYLYMVTYFNAYKHPIHIYIHLWPYTSTSKFVRPYTYTGLHTTILTLRYIFAYVYVLLRIHVYIYLRPHTYSCFLISTPIYLYSFTFFYPCCDANLHTSTPI
jgi:hypothetical protein